jgi:transcriptional regulator with XRE-family HTH domain
MGENRVPSKRLRDHRKQRGRSQQDLANEVLAVGHQIGEDNLGLTFKQVSRWERGWAEPRPPYAKILCLVFSASAQELGLYDPTETSADIALPTVWQAENEEGPSSNTSEKRASMRRRDFLKLTLAASLVPEALGRVLRGAAAEAMEFTRLTGVSLVGPGTFDHLEAVLTDLDRSYSKESPAEIFVVARAYRMRVEELIQGPHTLKEARDLYRVRGAAVRVARLVGPRPREPTYRGGVCHRLLRPRGPSRP